VSDHNNACLINLPDAAATRALGAELARGLAPGLQLHLHGELGAGKTTLVQGLLAALGHSGRVKSPTYTLVEVYELSRLNLYHFDFYRFRDGDEWRDAGFSEVFGGDAICMVEWPEKAGDGLPHPDIDITLHVNAEPDTRRALIVAHTTAGAQCCASLAASFSPGKSS
jgi:tRNA threonylcarbamoyladenosine biosynthesis protein TsaE